MLEVWQGQLVGGLSAVVDGSASSGGWEWWVGQSAVVGGPVSSVNLT